MSLGIRTTNLNKKGERLLNSYIRNIKDTIGAYQLDQLNCFERPTAVIYKYIYPGSEHLYIMYRKLFQSFAVSNDQNELRDFEDETGVQRHKIAVKTDVIPLLTRLLKEGHPVLVPINLKELYYSRYYKTQDWGHLFLIKGFDEEKKLFFIMDSLQFPPKVMVPCYYDFAIKYEDLYEAFNQYKGACGRCLYYFEKSSTEKKQAERFLKFLKILNDVISRNQYIEYEVIRYFQQAGNIQVDDLDPSTLKVGNDMINTPKYKSVMMEQLILGLDKFHYNTKHLSDLSVKLGERWNLDNLMFMKTLQKANFNKVSYIRTEETKQYEMELLQEIKNCISFLSNVHEDSSNLIPLPCENNEDQIISYKEGNYIFDFHTDDIYNTWLDDECPKVIVYEKKNTDYLRFHVKCSIMKGFNASGHQEGIFIRTDKNELYTFALNFENQYILDYVGKYTMEIFLNKENIQEVELYIEYNKNNLSVGILNQNYEYVKLGHYELDINIQQCGVFCKTWNDCKSLKVCFSNEHVETECTGESQL